MSAAGITATNRALLERLHRRARGPFTVEEAADLLGVSRPRARRLVRYLGARGWLDRIRRGLYVTVPLDSHRSGEHLEDPWLVADAVFDPCYIGGWSAAEHWDLTEQIFRDVLVVTARRPREREVTLQGTTYRVHTLGLDRHFGLTSTWREGQRIQVSDPSRTVVDVLAHPGWGGGMRHIAGVVEEYLLGEHRNPECLVTYADRLGNRSVFKRLGYLIEALDLDEPDLLATCLDRRSAGITDLDPSADTDGKISTRWNLRANVSITREASM